MKSLFYFIFLTALVIKAVLAAYLPLAPDEAYYTLWSQHLQMSYFDHPPMVAWLIYCSRKWMGFFPAPELTVRLLGVLLHHGTMWMMVRIYQNVRSHAHIGFEEIAVLLLFLFHPLLGFLQILQTPDLPLLFFWSAATWMFFRLLEKPSLSLMFTLGFLLGLGFVSKYMIVLWGLSLIVLFVFRFQSKSLRFLIQPKNILIGLVGLFAASAPVWIWNYQNEWASFKFQLSHGFEARGFEWHWVQDYVAGVCVLGLGYFAAIRMKAIQEFNDLPQLKILFLLIQFFIPFLFFLNSAFHAPTEVNWPIMGYMNLPLIVVLLARSARWMNGALAISGLTSTIMVAVILLGWPKISQIEQMKDLKKIGQNLSPDFQPLYTCQYQTAASLSFYSQYPVYKLQNCSRYDFYDSKPEFSNHHKTFFIYKNAGQEIPPEYMPARVSLVAPENDDNAIYKVERNL